MIRISTKLINQKTNCCSSSTLRPPIPPKITFIPKSMKEKVSGRNIPGPCLKSSRRIIKASEKRLYVSRKPAADGFYCHKATEHSKH